MVWVWLRGEKNRFPNNIRIVIPLGFGFGG